MIAEVAIDRMAIGRRWLLVISLIAHAVAIATVAASYDPVMRLRFDPTPRRATTVYLLPAHPRPPRIVHRPKCGGPHGPTAEPDPPWPFAPLDCDRAAFVFLPCD